MSQSGNYGNYGDLERSGAEMVGGTSERRILRRKRDGGSGRTAPILVRRTSRWPRRDRASARAAYKFGLIPQDHGREGFIEWRNIMGQVSLPAFQKSSRFQNGLKSGIRATFDWAGGRREAFYTYLVNRTRFNEVTWLGNKKVDVLSHPLSDIGHGGAVTVQRRFSRARWLFARAHGRPDGVPGGIFGAREKSLRRTERRRPCRRSKGAHPKLALQRRKR
jgi:hypothetical protein